MELPLERFPETRVLFPLLLSVELPLVVLLAALSLSFFSSLRIAFGSRNVGVMMIQWEGSSSQSQKVLIALIVVMVGDVGNRTLPRPSMLRPERD